MKAPMCDCRKPKAIKGTGDGYGYYLRCAGCSGKIPEYWVHDNRAEMVDPPGPPKPLFDRRFV